MKLRSGSGQVSLLRMFVVESLRTTRGRVGSVILWSIISRGARYRKWDGFFYLIASLFTLSFTNSGTKQNPPVKHIFAKRFYGREQATGYDGIYGQQNDRRVG